MDSLSFNLPGVNVPAARKILVVVTSNSALGDSGRETGLWAEELAMPYRVLEEAGLGFDIASPKGGTPPIDGISLADEYMSPAIKEFLDDSAVQERLTRTITLVEAAGRSYDGVFVVGGFGVMWDLVGHRDLTTILASAADADRPIAAVCHAPAALARVRLADGTSLVDGRSVTGFSNAEEDAVALGVDYPATVEDALRAAGGKYEHAERVFDPHVVTDGRLHTGQNPASSEVLARRLAEDVLR
jgi:putative intracellular protease/amidase